MRTGTEGWQDMDSAPKDGTILELLIRHKENEFTPIYDQMVSPTIGHNSLEHTGEDRWEFAGWDWCQDEYTRGLGTPIAWRTSSIQMRPDELHTLTEEFCK